MNGIQLKIKTPDLQVSMGEIGVKSSSTDSGSLVKTISET